jgi:hypothetical protein
MEPGDCWLNRESVQSAAHGGPVCGRLRLAPAIRKIPEPHAVRVERREIELSENQD